MASADVLHDQDEQLCVRRAELQAVLSSELFQRAPKLSRILAYMCEKYFEGTAANLKEYSIAVDALGRPPGFDPQSDAIVRVDLHLLRKRLDSYYASEGSSHHVRIVLPSGRYAPEFVRNGSEKTIRQSGSRTGSVSTADPVPPQNANQLPLRVSVAVKNESDGDKQSATPQTVRARGRDWINRRTILVAILSCLVGALGGTRAVLGVRKQTTQALWIFTDVPAPLQSASASIFRHFSFGGAPDMLDRAIRIRCGASQNYIDASHFIWSSDRYFVGGTEFQRPSASILRSRDAELYSTGRQGVFHYDIPVNPGRYEVHLLFAETAPGVQDGMRETSYIIGTEYSDTIDVVADAGGASIATTKIYPNVRPGDDGKIHLNFWSTNGFLNALEILPQSEGKPGPVRVSTLSTMYTDLAGRHWLSDRFFLGGRNVSHEFSLNRSDIPIFARERYGNFSYAIPVAPGYSYQLTLYMAERYWGPRNSGLGGAGSRIFSVRCNGDELLHNFDLLKEAGDAGAVAIRFQHLHPDATGKLNLAFLPIKNYPLVNALEVDPE